MGIRVRLAKIMNPSVKFDYKIGDKIAVRKPCLYSNGIPASLKYGMVYTIKSITKRLGHTYGLTIQLKDLSFDNDFCPSWFVPVYKEETFKILYGDSNNEA